MNFLNSRCTFKLVLFSTLSCRPINQLILPMDNIAMKSKEINLRKLEKIRNMK